MRKIEYCDFAQIQSSVIYFLVYLMFKLFRLLKGNHRQFLLEMIHIVIACGGTKNVSESKLNNLVL